MFIGGGGSCRVLRAGVDFYETFLWQLSFSVFSIILPYASPLTVLVLLVGNRVESFELALTLCLIPCCA